MTADKGIAAVVTAPAELEGERDLRVVYLRRKRARGLVALHSGQGEGQRMACVSVDEATLDEHGFGARATVRWFPEDPALPALRVCCEPGSDAGLWAALELAASVAAGSGCRLISAEAAPLRYKPHDRCVLRYRLTLRAPDGEPIAASVIGKVLRRAADARRIHAIAELLHRRRAGVVPQPLGLIEQLGLVLAADERDASSVPRPGALPRAASALAVFHCCPPGDSCPPYAGTREAAKALARVNELARSVPVLEPRLRHLGRRLAESLSASRVSAPCLVHGSFKPSQLLFRRDGSVVVTDLDACRVADPALDLGYFQAYLRSASLWQGDGRARAQYEEAARRFRREYAAAMVSAGREASDVEDALARAAVYEAALLLKIATRRVHRLNSPRPRELQAIVGEAEARLDSARERSR